MALDLQADNKDIEWKLECILNTKHTKLLSSLRMSGGFDSYHYGFTPSELVIDLTYYVDQLSTIKDTDLLTDIESRLVYFLGETGGVFTKRYGQPFRSPQLYKLYYEVKLPNYDSFITGLNKIVQRKIDNEFAKELEQKLSED